LHFFGARRAQTLQSFGAMTGSLEVIGSGAGGAAGGSYFVMPLASRPKGSACDWIFFTVSRGVALVAVLIDQVRAELVDELVGEATAFWAGERAQGRVSGTSRAVTSS
jgi:hypothetical protein